MSAANHDLSFTLGSLCNLTHGANPRRREGPTLGFEVVYDALHNLAQLAVKGYGVVTMYPRDEVRTLSNVHLILIAPLHPLVVFVEIFHLLTILSVRATSFLGTV
ncbi:MAG: hypothetical protein P8Y25_01280 [Chromatiaceae bacterium]